ncbi:MAG: hypothetical protein SFV81_06685 [Pirellulaceae bacterium]|nr:hypothetical protein [Pirellulaceae bacterium]
MRRHRGGGTQISQGVELDVREESEHTQMQRLLTMTDDGWAIRFTSRPTSRQGVSGRFTRFTDGARTAAARTARCCFCPQVVM